MHVGQPPLRPVVVERQPLVVDPEQVQDRRVKVGLAEKPEDCLGFARGFCDGAMGFWKEAKDKI